MPVLICPLCDSPLPLGLAMLQKCQHVGHAPCLSSHIRQHGHCPYANCKVSATEDEVLVMRIETPQPTNFFGQNDQREVGEVIQVIRQRLVGLRAVADAPDSEFNKLGQIFERFPNSKNSCAAPPPEGGADVVELVETKSAWDELKDFLWKASPIIAMVVFALLCWYSAPLLLSGSVLMEGVSTVVMRLATFLYSYIPEIVTSGIAIFSTYFLSKKKLCD